MDDIKQELSAKTIPKHQQDFYIWLRTIPLGALYSLYKQHTARRGQSDSSTNVITDIPPTLPQNSLDTKNNKIILRKSVFILVLTFINIEILFDGLYILLRLPLFYLNLPTIIQAHLVSMYFIIFLAINTLKLFFIIFVSVKWITTIYEIREGEIKFRQGLIAYSQKVYLCKHIQEVICKQGFIGKIFNFGSIELYDPTLTNNLNIDCVQNPSKYADIIKKNLLQNNSEFIPINTIAKV